MNEPSGWKVSLSKAADADVEDIIVWTTMKFGEMQAVAYEETLYLAIDALAEGPDVVGARRRDDLQTGIFTLHVARHGRRGSHILVSRITGEHEIEIVRILHDAMDIARHITGEDQP